MKKVLAMLLALVMVLSLGTVAMASSNISGGTTGKTEGDIIVNVEGGSVAPVYSITVVWTSLTFTYQQGAAHWDSENREYDYDAGKWANGNTGTITVTNKSNVAIDVSAEIINETGNFKATLTNDEFTLASYAEVATAESDVITVTVALNADEGDLAENQSGAIGTVKLSIS